MSRNKLWEDWEAARVDLLLEIVVPYEIEIDSGVKLQAEFLVKNFGAKSGMLIFKSSDVVWPH